MKTSVPLYHHLKAELLQSIENGTWSPGDPIPSEAALSRSYRVSRITVRQAIGDLVSLGYLTRHQGKGTFVAKRWAALAASRLYGFAEELRDRGHDVQIELQSIRTLACPEVVRHQLQVSPLTPVIEVSRVARVGGNPVFRETSFLLLPPQVTMTELSRHSGLHNHIYGFFEQYGVKIAFGKQRVSADLASARDIEELQVVAGDPVLVIRRVTSDETGTPVEFSEVRYPANLFEYEVVLARGSQGRREENE